MNISNLRWFIFGFFALPLIFVLYVLIGLLSSNGFDMTLLLIIVAIGIPSFIGLMVSLFRGWRILLVLRIISLYFILIYMFFLFSGLTGWIVFLIISLVLLIFPVVLLIYSFIPEIKNYYGEKKHSSSSLFIYLFVVLFLILLSWLYAIMILG